MLSMTEEWDGCELNEKIHIGNECNDVQVGTYYIVRAPSQEKKTYVGWETAYYR